MMAILCRKPLALLRCEKDFRLCIPRSTNKYGQRAFSSVGPTLWNSLPRELRIMDNLCAFKKSLKTFLFVKAYKDIIQLQYIYTIFHMCNILVQSFFKLKSYKDMFQQKMFVMRSVATLNGAKEMTRMMMMMMMIEV